LFEHLIKEETADGATLHYAGIAHAKLLALRESCPFVDTVEEATVIGEGLVVFRENARGEKPNLTEANIGTWRTKAASQLKRHSAQDKTEQDYAIRAIARTDLEIPENYAVLRKLVEAGNKTAVGELLRAVEYRKHEGERAANLETLKLVPFREVQELKHFEEKVQIFLHRGRICEPGRFTSGYCGYCKSDSEPR
jgi:hypothetical protein